METSYTPTSIHLKSVYPHSHINLYNAPIIGATMPTIAIAPGLNLVGQVQTNGIVSIGSQESNSLNTSASIQATNSLISPSAAQSVPMTSASVCFDNFQFQQALPTLHQQAFTPNHELLSFGNSRNNNIHYKVNNPLSQIQMTAPAIPLINFNTINNNSNSNTSTNSETHSSILIGAHHLHRETPRSITPINNSSPKSSNRSTDIMSRPDSNNLAKTISASATSHQKISMDGNNYVDLAKASCSSSSNNTSIISMRTISSSNSSFSTEFDNNNTSNSPRKNFKCRVCERSFSQKGNLKTHLMTHSGERPYECSTCGKNFTQKGNLDTHVKIHTETKDHRCTFCDRGFTQRGNLRTHIRSVHTKEKPYACGHCGKSFSQKGNMLTHFRTHDKDSRFPCNVCGKTFSQKGNLKTHQQRHGRRACR